MMDEVIGEPYADLGDEVDGSISQNEENHINGTEFDGNDDVSAWVRI
jgi:hypothetical protein